MAKFYIWKHKLFFCPRPRPYYQLTYLLGTTYIFNWSHLKSNGVNNKKKNHQIFLVSWYSLSTVKSPDKKPLVFLIFTHDKKMTYWCFFLLPLLFKLVLLESMWFLRKPTWKCQQHTDPVFKKMTQYTI